MNRKVLVPVFFLMALVFASCASKKQVVVSESKSSAPFGEVYSMPCGEFRDTPEKFAAVGI